MSCGDLVGRNKPEYFKTFLSLMKRSMLKPLRERWRLISGDHERRDDGSIKNNFEAILDYATHYKTEVGNILFLHMGNKYHGNADWSKDELHWWRKQVVENRDKVIIVFSHPAVFGTTPGSWDGDGFLRYSHYIIDVLKFFRLTKKAGVDIWFNGHKHCCQHHRKNTFKKFGTWFHVEGSLVGIGNCGAKGKHYSSWKLLTFTENSNLVKMKLRINGYKGELRNEWDEAGEFNFPLGTPVRLDRLE